MDENINQDSLSASPAPTSAPETNNTGVPVSSAAAISATAYTLESVGAMVELLAARLDALEAHVNALVDHLNECFPNSGR